MIEKYKLCKDQDFFIKETLTIEISAEKKENDSIVFFYPAFNY